MVAGKKPTVPPVLSYLLAVQAEVLDAVPTHVADRLRKVGELAAEEALILTRMADTGADLALGATRAALRRSRGEDNEAAVLRHRALGMLDDFEVTRRDAGRCLVELLAAALATGRTAAPPPPPSGSGGCGGAAVVNLHTRRRKV